MPVLKNPRYEAFAQEYHKTGHGTKSATKAGYSEKTAHVQSTRLLKNAKISSRLKELKDRVAKRLEDKEIITKEEIMIGFKQNAELAQADGKYGDFNTAYANLGKIKGVYDEDNKQKQPKIDISLMTTEQLLQLARGGQA